MRAAHDLCEDYALYSRAPNPYRALMSFIHAPLRNRAARLLRHPLFALGAGLVLALGVAATTALLAVVRGVALRPLPYEDPDRLVVLVEDGTAPSAVDWPTTVGRLDDFSAVGRVRRRPGGHPRRRPGAAGRKRRGAARRLPRHRQPLRGARRHGAARAPADAGGRARGGAGGGGALGRPVAPPLRRRPGARRRLADARRRRAHRGRHRPARRRLAAPRRRRLGAVRAHGGGAQPRLVQPAHRRVAWPRG